MSIQSWNLFNFEKSQIFSFFGSKTQIALKILVLTKNFICQIPSVYFSYKIIQGQFQNFHAHINVSIAIKCGPPQDFKVAKMSGQIGLR